MLEEEVTVYRAGTVYSPGSSGAEAFGVAGGRFVATGSVSELRDRFPGSGIVDLGPGTVLPGFNDAHAHLADSVQGRLDLDVSPGHAPDIDALVSRIRTRASSGEWILAANYDDSLTGPLHRDLLDAAFPGSPVLVRHVSAHWAVLNTAALSALGIEEGTDDIAGGTYGRDEDGRLNGRVYERALLGRYVTRPGDPLRPIPLASPSATADLYDEALSEWNALGITSTCDAFVGPQQLGLHSAGRRSGVRRMRVGMLLAAECYDDYRSLGLGTGMGDDWLRVVGIKAFVDGAIGGRTCLVSEPFYGTHDHGMSISSPEELNALVRRVHGEGDRLGIHANGDAAIRLLLDAYESAQREAPSAIRHRIEHCSIVDPEIVARIARLRLVVTPFARYASFYGGRLESWYGAERTERMFAHRALLDAGVTVAASTDHPASPLSPLAAIQSMVTRTGDDGAAVGRSQRIGVDEAIDVYTSGSAAASGEEHTKGRILPGYLADFTVLDRDPRAADPAEIADLAIQHTFVDGARVYSAA